MIVDFIVTAFLAGLDAVLGLLPVVAIPAVAALGFAADFAGIVSGVHRVVPLGDVLVLLGLAVVCMVAMGVWDVSVFIYHQFWGAS